MQDKGQCANFVGIHADEVVEDKSKRLMLLEYLDGSTLASELNKRPPHDLQWHRRVAFQVVYALHAAQKELRFTHNDLHSENVMLQSMPPEKQFLECHTTSSS